MITMGFYTDVREGRWVLLVLGQRAVLIAVERLKTGGREQFRRSSLRLGPVLT